MLLQVIKRPQKLLECAPPFFVFAAKNLKKATFLSFENKETEQKRTKRERERDRKNNGRSRASLRKLFQLLAATVAAKR